MGRQNRAPGFRGHVCHMLRERPPVPSVVLRRVLAFAERHCGWWLDDLSAVCTRALKVDCYIRDRNVHILSRLACLRRERSAGLSEHHCAIADCKLRMADCAVGSGSTQPFLKPETAAEPINSGGYVIVDKDRNNGRRWRRAVSDHMRFFLQSYAAK